MASPPRNNSGQRARASGKKPKRGGHKKPPAPKRPVGRPPKLTPEVHEQIVTAVAAGNFMETAAAYAGIHKDTLHDWMKRGRAELSRLAGSKDSAKIAAAEERYVAFVIAVEEAIARSEVRDVALIARAGRVDWRALAWRLEKRHQRRWGPKLGVGFEGELPPLTVVVQTGVEKEGEDDSAG